MSRDKDEPEEFKEVYRPILTTEPNLRGWIRNRRLAAAWARKAEESLESVTSIAQAPWDDVRPATAEDIAPGAVLWRKIPGKEGFFLGADAHEWFYVERVSEDPGTFVDHKGVVRNVEGMLAEEHTEEAIAKAKGVEKMLSGGPKSSIGMFLDAVGIAAKGTLYVSPMFHKDLTEEVGDLLAEHDRGGVSMLYGWRVVVDEDLELTTFRKQSPDGTATYDPNGLRFKRFAKEDEEDLGEDEDQQGG